MWPTLLVLLYSHIAILTAKKLTYYADFEHPNVTYYNRKYMEYVNVTAQRFNRHDPIHYVSMNAKSLIVFGNNIKLDGYVYELLSNVYRPSMIEVHFKLCDASSESKFKIFKPIYSKYLNDTSCPFPKGEYHFMNISIPNLPLLATFPFYKGRIVLKASLAHTGERVIEGYMDGAIKQRFV